MYPNNERQIHAQQMIAADDLKWPAAILLRTGMKNYQLARIE
jgi:hypothetical protein